MKIMFKLLVLLICFLYIFIAFAAEDDSSKISKYQETAKNEWTAVAGSWLLPTLGHAYAEDWLRGLPFLGAEIGGVVLIATDTKGNGTNTAFGLITLLVARIWEYFDAYDTACDFNDNLKRKYGLTLQVTDDVPVLAVNLRF